MIKLTYCLVADIQINKKMCVQISISEYNMKLDRESIVFGSC